MFSWLTKSAKPNNTKTDKTEVPVSKEGSLLGSLSISSQYDPVLADLIVLFKNINSSPDLRIPNILIIEILNWADFSPIFAFSKSTSVTLRGHDNQNELYFRVPIMRFKYFTINAVTYRVDSHDQGWSSYPSERGSRSSNTFGQAAVSTDGEKRRFQAYRNIHACDTYERQETTFDRESEFVQLIHEQLHLADAAVKEQQDQASKANVGGPGEKAGVGASSGTEVEKFAVEPVPQPELQLWLLSQYPGWNNFVRFAEIELRYKFTDWTAFIHDHCGHSA